MTKKASPSYAERGRMGGRATRKRLSPEKRRSGARKAALARWQKTTKEQRREIARKAVKARWARAKGKKGRP